MKKLAGSLFITLILILASCDLTQLDSIIRVSSNVPVTVEKLHFAVLSGDDVLVQKVFLRSELNSDGAIEIYVSSGKNRTLVLVTEDINGYANYFSSKTVDIEAGKEFPVTLSMKVAVWDQAGPNIYEIGSSDIYWDSTGIVKTRYHITDEFDSTKKLPVIYGTSVEQTLLWDNSIYNPQLVVEFYPSGLKTQPSASLPIG